MKTAELTGDQLDYWVAKALGSWDSEHEFRVTLAGHPVLIVPAISIDDNAEAFTPSTLWAHGGPVIERARVSVQTWPDHWAALYYGNSWAVQGIGQGPTALIAAMRAIVAGSYGIEVPANVRWVSEADARKLFLSD